MRILLNRFHAKSPKEFLSLLPKEDVQEILSKDVITSEIDPVFVNPKEFLKNVHFSWTLPYVQKLPQQTQKLLISALPNPLAFGLRKYLKIEHSKKPIPNRASAFFIKKLYDQIHESNVLDPTFLPKSELSVLLDFPIKELLELIDFLGLYDLAEAIRNVVDKKSLQTVYSCLTPKKLQFVRMCLHQKSKIAVPKLDLHKWDGNCAGLLQNLHQRGLYRLGKALSGSHPDFLWHLLHRLDTGRSAILEKYYSKQSSPGITPLLVQQVTNVMNFLRNKE